MIKQALLSRELLPFAGLLLIFAIFDVSYRLLPEQAESNHSRKAVQFKEGKVVKFSPDDRKVIDEKLQKYEEEGQEGDSQNDQRMSLEDQLKQSGDLKQLHSGDYSYRLYGIFHQEQGFAVIEKLHMVTGASEIIRLAEQDTIDGYSVREIMKDRMLFEANDERKITLYLYEQINN